MCIHTHIHTEREHTYLLELLLLQGAAHALEQAHPRVGLLVFLHDNKTKQNKTIANERASTTGTRAALKKERKEKSGGAKYAINALQSYAAKPYICSDTGPLLLYCN